MTQHVFLFKKNMSPRHEMPDSDWIVIKKGTPPADKVGVAVGRAAPSAMQYFLKKN
jgi:hypothetical protein